MYDIALRRVVIDLSRSLSAQWGVRAAANAARRAACTVSGPHESRRRSVHIPQLDDNQLNDNAQRLAVPRLDIPAARYRNSVPQSQRNQSES
jgi:hypothetical protein